ncbi:hypothetical protein PRUPE_3G243600 [Prunus persica]|uniref:Peptidase M41 FtsH extracellular domain-containing protein n=1 Tax=Prunus persica TaxID=3760 RepID=A0A251Q4X9_PRUPE|nr:hypothetical protein PRUPE_3G243600 [Prunus persica]
MACFSVVCNTGFLSIPNKLEVHGRKSKSLGRYRGFCCRSFAFRSLGYHKFCNFQHGLLWNNELRPLSNGKSGVFLKGFNNRYKSKQELCCYNKIEPLTNANSANKQMHLGKKGNTKLRSLRKRFSLRLRPRLRLLTIRLKTVTIRSVLNGIGTFLRKNIRRVTLFSSISATLGLCYLFLKLTAVPSPKMVPYSELITSLRNDSVTKVLLEEGSRRIYYNTNCRIAGDTHLFDEELTNVQGENMADKVTSDDGSRSDQALNTNVLKKLSVTQASTPDWQYSTRKIDHDEKFLLSLMREKGITYSSAPQSVLMSMRTTLITIISLWIPLLPLMWLLYRQLTAGNSPAKKRRPDNQSVGFDDVEGVDSAKLELMEFYACKELLTITNWEQSYLEVYCWWVLQEQGKHYSPVQWLEKQVYHFSLFLPVNLWRCLLEEGQLALETFLIWQGNIHHRSYSLMSLTRLEQSVAEVSMMSVTKL